MSASAAVNRLHAEMQRERVLAEQRERNAALQPRGRQENAVESSPRDARVLATVARVGQDLSNFRVKLPPGQTHLIIQEALERAEAEAGGRECVVDIGADGEPLWVDLPLLKAMQEARCFSTLRADAPIVGGGGARDPRDRKTTEELLALADARAFNFTVEVPPPHPVFSIGDRIISTPGNLTAVSAQAKAGKSAVVGAMIAAVFNDSRQGADTLGLAAMNPDGLALIHLDTEQSRHDHDKLVRKAIRRANVEAPPPWFRSYWLTDCSVLDRRILLPKLIQRASAECGGIFAVILDGGADLIASVNDEESARGFVAELHTLAIDHDCAVIVIVHENPGTTTGKTRGHFGSEIERKAETNLRLERDGNGTVTLWADRARHCTFPKSEGVCFAWSMNAGMFVTKGTAGEIRNSEKRCKMAEEIERIGEVGERFAYTALVQRIMERVDLKESSAKKRVATYIAEGLLLKNESGTHYIP
jgi:hypothetical protein